MKMSKDDKQKEHLKGVAATKGSANLGLPKSEVAEMIAGKKPSALGKLRLDGAQKGKPDANGIIAILIGL